MKKENLKDVIESKKHNIGSLTTYIKNRDYLLNELKDFIDPNHVDNLSIPQMVWYYVNNVKEIQLCICGKHKKWMTFKEGWRASCGAKKCYVEQRKLTNTEKYGCDNPSKNKEVREKRAKSNLEKYGYDNVAKSKDIQSKISKTKLGKSDEEIKRIYDAVQDSWRSKSDEEIEEIKRKRLETFESKSDEEIKEIKRKRKNTLMDNYGVEYTFNSEEIQDKIKKTKLERYGHEHHFYNKEIQSKRAESYRNNRIKKLEEKIKKWDCTYISHDDTLNYKLFCNRSNKPFTISYTNLRVKLLADVDISVYFNKRYGTSKSEQEIFEFIKENYKGEVINGYRDKTNKSNKEIDIYIPEINLGIEHNGLYWHSELFKENNFHLEKSEHFKKQDIRLIHVWEDDWLFKKDIIKSRLKSILKLNEKIFARNCIIKEIDAKEARPFFDKTHLQGFISAKHYIGLYYNNILVCCMSFGSLRKNLNSSSKMGEFELYRYSSMLNFTVVGGGSKILKYFIEKYKPKRIISYQDKSWGWGDNKVYKKLGFTHIHDSVPSYHYIVDKEYRVNRYKFRKDILVKEGYDPLKTEHEIMLERNIFRIYDCGNEKWEYII